MTLLTTLSSHLISTFPFSPPSLHLTLPPLPSLLLSQVEEDEFDETHEGSHGLSQEGGVNEMGGSDLSDAESTQDEEMEEEEEEEEEEEGADEVVGEEEEGEEEEEEGDEGTGEEEDGDVSASNFLDVSLS